MNTTLRIVGFLLLGCSGLLVLGIAFTERRKNRRRDRFARIAMHGLLSGPKGLDNEKLLTSDMLARFAYKVADAMLAESEKLHP